jgi:DNA-binding GntR family transcriptional regulator
MKSGTADAEVGASEPSRLQRELADRMIDLFRSQEVAPGDRLTELSLARHLNVSRTPIRSALRMLAHQGVVKGVPGRGFTFVRYPAALTGMENADVAGLAEDRLIVAVAQDRLANGLPNQVSEADLMRRYAASRPVVARALTSLAEAGVITRKPGYGWMFEPIPSDPAAREESYRFRLLIEPAALLEPGFRLDPLWVAEMRDRHERAMRDPWHDAASVAFFEMNAGFHEGLAKASGNRFIHLSVVHQNRVRRFRNYHWTHHKERVLVNCEQHLEILDRLKAGDNEIASVLMRRHIEQARRLPT